MFDAKRYTVDGLIKQLLLLELHIRDGSVYECGCAWDQHLPVIEGLSEEGVKFAMSQREREFFDRLMHTARDYRLALQYGTGGEKGMEIEEEHSSNPALTVETLRTEGNLIEGSPENGIYQKDAMYYVIKGDTILWSGRQKTIAETVFKERDPEPRYVHEELKPSELCEPSSFRTVVRDEHRVVVCCPKGEYDHETKTCKIGTITQKILHPIWEKEKEELGYGK